MPHRPPEQAGTMSPWPAVLFDLDGTLLDTLQDIADAANGTLAHFGLTAHPVDAYRQFVGSGVARLFARAIPDDSQDQEIIARCVERFREAYEQNWNAKTKPYDGVVPLLDQLAARRVRMAVLSNKPDEFTQKCTQHYLPQAPFEVVVGQRDGLPRKPDPAAAEMIAQQMGVPPEQFLFLGDSVVDMETARRAGMRPVGAGWGFRSGRELPESGAVAVLRHPIELLDMVDHQD
jgi:phosphoglycolate phosphatase